MTTKTFDTQTARFLSSVAQAMPALSSEEMQKWIQNPIALKKLLKSAFKQVEQETFNISEHFTTGPGLWVDSDFTSRIARPLGTVPMRSLSDLKDPTILPRDMSDSEICRELLGGKEQASVNAVCPSQIWQLIQLQEGGALGKLLNDGLANIFYVIGKDGVLFAVRVVWDSGLSMWDVVCLFVQLGRWGRGRQVFSN